MLILPLWCIKVVSNGDSGIYRMRRRPLRPADVGLALVDYRLLGRFRHLLRQFFAFSEEAARAAGVTVQQHQAVLSIKTFDGQATIGDLARDLMIKPHSAVGLINRLVRARLVTRIPDPRDCRRVTLALTPRGEEVLLTVSGANRQKLRSIAPLIRTVITELER
jgi:DNA-binding MarR family transcriptional regulator